TGWNRWLEIASGRSAASVLGHALTEIFPDFADSSGERALIRAIAGETVVLAHRFHQAFLKLPCTPGEDFDCMQQSTRIVPHIDQDGRIAGAIALIEDVTERVARDRELRQALTEAKAANQIKAEFLATMSHELRTPLGAIAGYTDLLVDGIVGELTDPQRQHMVRIKRVAGHVLGIVDEILTFSRLQAGREELHLEEVDAGLLAREAAQVVEPSLAAKGLEFHIELPKGHLTLVTDELKASQILINLLGNAAKFVERGQVT